MRRNRGGWKRWTIKLFRRRLLLVAVVLLLLLLCLYQGFAQMVRIIRQQEDERALNFLGQVEDAGELLIDELLNLSEELVGHETLVNFCVGQTGGETDIIALFNETVQVNPLLRNVYVITPTQTICLSASGRENLGGITSMLSPRGSKLVLEPGTFEGRFQLLNLVPGKAPSVSSLTFARPIMDVEARRVGMLLFLLDRNNVNVRNGAFMLPVQYDLYWLDSANDILYNTNTIAGIAPPPYEELRERVPQQVKGEAGGPDVRCYMAKSPQADLAYTILAVEPSYTSMALRVYLPVILGILLILAAAFWFFMRYIRRQSRAISNSFRVLAENGIVGRDDADTEGLDKLVVKLVAEKEILSKRLARFRSLDLDNKLARVLAGDEEPDDSFRLPYPVFAVCVVSVDNQSIFSKDKSINASEEKALIKLVVDNVLSEHYLCYSRYAGKKIACLLNFREQDGKTALQTIRGELEALRQVCEQELELIFIAGLSDTSERRDDIGLLYEQSVRAQEYARLHSQPLVAYGDIERRIHHPELAGNYYKRLIEKEQIVIESCNPWNYRNMTAAMGEFEKLLFGNPANTFENVRDKCREVFRAIVNTMRQNRQAEIYSPADEKQDLAELELCNTSEQMQVFFTLFLKKLDDCVTNSRVEEQDYFIAKVENILEKNYSDMSLSVGRIADELNMPMRLVSSQYKQKTGYGLLDRIHSFRIEKAKAMLLETQDSVYEIAERCGYENVNTFIRVFRKYTGQTPGRFRGN